MHFDLTAEQRGFARSLDDLLAAADTPAVVRAWSGGDHDPGLKLWQRLADLGVTGLLVPEAHGGLDASAVDLVVAFEALGRHAVPGPWVESVALLPALLDGSEGHDDLLAAVAGGECLASVAAPPRTPYALDADVATTFVLDGEGLRGARRGEQRASLDPARRLFEVSPGAVAARPDVAQVDSALDVAALATSAQLLGLGERLLESSVGYVKARQQFGRPIGSFQALKHALADVRIGLDFARPLVLGAALTWRGETGARDVSAAKVKAADAAYLAARTALQVHGAIGYTAEYDLSLWLLKVRALVAAWGTPALHRGRLLALLVQPAESAQEA